MMVSIWAVLLAVTAGDGVIPFKDGDRVVFVGDTIIERDAAYGYLETEIIRRCPDVKLTFRNLGWSGDTPAGISRAYFDSPEVGFQRLVEQVKATKPTILFVGYGMADSLENASPQAFEASMNHFLDSIKDVPTRLVFLSPVNLSPRQIKAEHEKLLVAYAGIIKKIANQRKGEFVDLTSKSPAKELIDANGIHLNEAGHRWFASEVLSQLQVPDEGSKLVVASPLDKDLTESGVTLDIAPRLLPTLLKTPSDVEVSVNFLKPGTYRFTIDDREKKIATANEWKGTIPIPGTPWVSQAAEMRRLVRRKNELYFQRYRPQNITYLLGFRSYEQGQNAKEIEQLDPMIAELEKKVEELRMPIPKKCTWAKTNGGEK